MLVFLLRTESPRIVIITRHWYIRVCSSEQKSEIIFITTHNILIDIRANIVIILANGRANCVIEFLVKEKVLKLEAKKQDLESWDGFIFDKFSLSTVLFDKFKSYRCSIMETIVKKSSLFHFEHESFGFFFK